MMKKYWKSVCKIKKIVDKNVKTYYNGEQDSCRAVTKAGGELNCS